MCVQCSREYSLKRYARTKDDVRLKNIAKKNTTVPKPKCCEFCGGNTKKDLCFDHCHETGKHRGWLCHKCNQALGLLGDNLNEIIKNVIRYDDLVRKRL
jgi:hypothetical protein